MNKILAAVVLSVWAVSLNAQAPADKTGSQAAGKTTTAAARAKSQAAAPAAQEASAADKKAEKRQQKQADADADDGTVMIDSKADQEDTGRYSSQTETSQPDRDAADVRGGIPTSYGQCKGVIIEGGRTILVFESVDDGTIYFVQVMVGKNTVSWKLVDHIGRSAD